MSAVLQPVAPVHAPSMRSHRFHLLDGLRGVAAILVVLFHAPLWLRPRLPLHQAWLAVDFFFLLSGFVIAYSYESRLLGGLRMRDFLIARLIRLYPLYLAGTLLGLISVVLVNSLSVHVSLSIPELAYALPPALLLLPNLLKHWPIHLCFPLDLPSFSLFLELVANVVFAALIRLRAGATPVLAVLSAGSLLLLGSAALRGISGIDAGVTVEQLPLGVARVLFSFLAGVLVFRFYRARPALFSSAVRASLLPVFTTLALTAVLVASSSLTRTVGYQLGVLLVVFPVLLLLGAYSQLPVGWNRVCALLGDVSYPMYILHAPLVFPLGGSRVKQFAEAHAGAAPWLLPWVVLFLIALSWLAARYPDRSFRLWLTRRYNAAAVAAAPKPEGVPHAH